MSFELTFMYDLAIIGGGPAGISAGIYSARKRLKTILIAKDFIGQSSASESVENWIGIEKISGIELSKILEKHLKSYSKDIDIKEGELCVSIEKTSDGFEIATKNKKYSAKAIIIATGSGRRKLAVKGADIFEHKGLTYCASCDGPMFSDQDVVVVGGGNSAFGTASQLMAYCKSVTIVDVAEKFRAETITIEKVLSNKNVRAIPNVKILEIKGDKFVNGMIVEINEKKEEIKTSGIFVEIGMIPNTNFVEKIVELDNYKKIKINPKNQQTSVKGIWAAGDCTDVLYNQNNIAAGDAIKAIEDAFLYLKA